MMGDVGPAVFIILGITFVIVTGIILVFGILYFRSAMRVLGGIKEGLTGAPVFQLPGIKLLTVLFCITIGFTLLVALFSPLVAPAIFDEMYSDLPDIFRDTFKPFIAIPGVSIVLSSIFTVVANAGSLLCVIVLNRFNGRLKLMAPTPY